MTFPAHIIWGLVQLLPGYNVLHQENMLGHGVNTPLTAELSSGLSVTDTSSKATGYSQCIRKQRSISILHENLGCLNEPSLNENRKQERGAHFSALS